MARADQLLVGMLTAMRREDELLATLLDDLQGEDSSDEEDEVEEMWIVQDLLTSVCALEARDGVITHGQRGTNRPPPGAGGYELWVKGPNLGIMAKVSYGSWT